MEENTEKQGVRGGSAPAATQAWPGLVPSASLGMIVAGLVHLAIAPLHWGHAPAHGLFFALSGAAQIVWGMAFWRKPSDAWREAGALMAGVMILLWVITRFLPAPFGDEPGEIELTGIISKLAEGLSFIALAVLSISVAAARKAKAFAWRRLFGSVIGSFVAGWLIYLTALAAAPLFPGLAEATARPEAGFSSNTDMLDDLQLVVAGIPSPFVNGDEIPLVGDLVAKVGLTPGDEPYSRNVDLYLYHQVESNPLSAATVQATARMRYMDHGTFQQMALPLDAGHYLLILPFPMPGEWQVDFEIATAEQENTIQLDIALFD